MPLTDAKVRAAKPIGGARSKNPGEPGVKKLSDGKGLQLWAIPTGGKLWRLAYRFDGKQRALALGAYPAVGLADARRKAEAARVLIAQGADPCAEKKAAKVAEAFVAPTFGEIAEEFLDKKRKEGRAEGTMDKLVWQIKLAAPFLAALPIADITVDQVYEALKSVQDKGTHETVRKMRSTLGGVFRRAIRLQVRSAADPTVLLQGELIAPTVRHRPAIIDPKALGGLLRAVDGFQGQPTTRACMQLLALLMTRPGELRLARWAEFDLEKATFEIPASRMKGRKAHVVPLPRQAIEILKALHPITGRFELVFPGLNAPTRPISENTLNGCLRRLGFSGDDMTAHGWRSTASSLLNQSGKWSPDAIERSLAHADRDKIRGIYARGAYWNERVQMMQFYADYLDELRAAV